MKINYLSVDVEIDEQDVILFSTRDWFINNGYLRNRQLGFFHNYIFPPPVGLVVDHINRNKLDNRRENLRHVTQSDNLRNSKDRKSKTGIRGVCENKGKYQVKIKIDKQLKCFGTYETLEEAEQVSNAIYKTLCLPKS